MPHILHRSVKSPHLSGVGGSDVNAPVLVTYLGVVFAAGLAIGAALMFRRC